MEQFFYSSLSQALFEAALAPQYSNANQFFLMNLNP